jgi:hypothetical protein
MARPVPSVQRNGNVQESQTLTIVCFRFSVEGTSYCWHQPDHLAIFEYEVTTDSSTGNPSEDFEKPITLSKTNLPPPRICCGGFCSKRPN